MFSRVLVVMCCVDSCFGSGIDPWKLRFVQMENQHCKVVAIIFQSLLMDIV